MRAVLKDFQSAAVEKLSRSLRRMTRDYIVETPSNQTGAPTHGGHSTRCARSNA